VLPGASVQATVTRNGLLPSLIVPEKTAGLAAGGEFVGGSLVPQNARGAVESRLKVQFPHSLTDRPKVVVGAGAGHVPGGIHQVGLVHGGTGRGKGLVDEILPEQGRRAGNAGGGVACPGGFGEELLADRKKVVGGNRAAI